MTRSPRRRRYEYLEALAALRHRVSDAEIIAQIGRRYPDGAQCSLHSRQLPRAST